LGYRAQGLGLRVEGAGFGFSESIIRVWEFRVWGLRLRVSDTDPDAQAVLVEGLIWKFWDP
jgi:hypothetical protein